MADSPILITGSTGEIGKIITEILLREGIPFLKFEQYLDSKPSNLHPERVLHLAGSADNTRPDSIIESNIGYLRTVVKKSEQAGIQEFIFFSSASVYGNQDKEDIDETEGMITPGLYGLSKLIGENILEHSNMKALCLRLPGVLELRKASNFLSRMFVTLQNNGDITIHNRDKKFNNYIDVWSLTDFVLQLTVTEKFDLINLGNDKQLTIMDIIELIKNALNSKSKIEYSDEYKPFFNLSIAKAVSRYGFNPGNPRDNIIRWCTHRLSETKTL